MKSKRIPIIEAMILDALDESAKKEERQKMLSSICGDKNHSMVWSGVYGCYKCGVCGKLSDYEDGSEYGHHPWYDRD